jgi:hypothetical protein
VAAVDADEADAHCLSLEPQNPLTVRGVPDTLVISHHMFLDNV